jgi:hypothetical protein
MTSTRDLAQEKARFERMLKSQSDADRDYTRGKLAVSNWRNFPQNRTSDRCFAINVYYPK